MVPPPGHSHWTHPSSQRPLGCDAQGLNYPHY
ncbi:hypothetical protein LUZ100_gp05 [Pseudomonas phage LUZ100]|nr:hypothetical protein LUZ100_gp05 [Pseudomonas phage LUZ100]